MDCMRIIPYRDKFYQTHTNNLFLLIAKTNQLAISEVQSANSTIKNNSSTLVNNFINKKHQT